MARQSGADLARVQQLLETDPVLRQLVQQGYSQSLGSIGDQKNRQLQAQVFKRLKELGIDTEGAQQGFKVGKSATGGLTLQKDKSFLEAAWPVLAAMGGAAAAPLLMGGAAAGAGGAGGAAAGAGGGAAAGGGILGAFKGALPWIQAGSQVLGKVAEGRAQGRREELLANEVANRSALDAARVDLDRREFTSRERNRDASRMALGDMLANLQDLNISVPGVPQSTITGGLRPSMLSQGTRQGGAELAKQAMLATLQGGPKFDPIPQLPVPSANGADKALGWGSTIGSLLGALPWKRPNASRDIFQPIDIGRPPAR